MGEFLGMGWLEILTIAVVALLVLGPDKLPVYARKIGRFIRQFRKITSGVTKEINKALELDDLDDGDDITKDIKNISKSLADDAAQLKKSLSGDITSLEETVNEGAAEVGKSLNKGSSDITDSLNAPAGKAGKGTAKESSRAKQSEAPASSPDRVASSSPEAMVDYKPPVFSEDTKPDHRSGNWE